MPDAPAGRTPYLTIVSPTGDRERADVTTFPFHIGRQAGNELVLRDSRISRVHAKLAQRGPHIAVEDCGSTHGLFVNRERVASDRLLVPGDIISFGEVTGDGYETGYELIFSFGNSSNSAALPELDRMPGEEHLAKLRSLVEVARALHASLQPEEVLGAVLDAALKLTGGERGFLLLKKDGELQVTLARAAKSVTAAIAPPSAASVPMERIRALLGSRAFPVATTVGNGLCVPLLRVRTGISPDTIAVGPNNTVGALYIESADLAQGNRELLETLAVEAASVLENAALLEQDQERRRMEQELEIARNIQRSLLPRKLPSPGDKDAGWLFAAGSSEPTNEVGGDFYDVIHVRPDLWSIAVADVSGKGASSALLAGLLQGAFLMAPENTTGIIAMLEHLNRYLYERTGGEKYATVFYAALERNGLLRWANAGHCNPYVLTVGGLQTLDTNAMPVGLLDPASFEVAKTQLAPGDKLVIYSDGLADAVNSKQENFDRPLRRLLRNSEPNETAVQLHTRIRNELSAFTGGQPQRDDSTLLIVEYRP